MSLSRVSISLSNIPDAVKVMELAKLMNDTGYERVWLAENRALEAAALGGAIAATTSLEVGTAIVPVYSRTPALLSMMAATWSQLAGGRTVHLGIGAGGQVIIERWHGVPFDKPVTTARETLGLLRQMLAGERSDLQGQMRRSTGFQLQSGPCPGVRLYIGGMGPAMTDLAAEAADGLIVTWLSPRVLRDFRASLGVAVAKHGRADGDVRLVARAYVAVTDTPQAVREEVRKEMVEYLISPPYGRYFRSVGFGEEVDAATRAFQARERERAVAAVSDRLIDEVLIVGASEAEIKPRLEEYITAGADDLLIQPVPAYRGGDPRSTIEAVAAAMR